LVNLLIAMMGDTFDNVKENSDKEWKYTRYDVIKEYQSASFHPPPFNLVMVPMKYILKGYRKLRHVDQPPAEKKILTLKQKEQFYNRLKHVKEDFLAEKAEQDSKTIGAVCDSLKDSVKNILDDAEMKHKVLEHYFSEALKSEIGTLSKQLMEAVKPTQPPESSTIRVQQGDVRVTWSTGVSSDLAQRVLNDYQPFKEWIEKYNKNSAGDKIQGIHLQAIGVVSGKVEFVKFFAQITNKLDQPLPGSIFMIGSSVAVLIVLKLQEEGAQDNGKEFTIITLQPRSSVGGEIVSELPAGTIDKGHFAGHISLLLNQEAHLDIKADDLIDLVTKASNGASRGIFTNPNFSDEVVKLYLYRKTVNKEQIKDYYERLTGFAIDNHPLNLKIISLDELIGVPDVKALSALCLYRALSPRGLI